MARYSAMPAARAFVQRYFMKSLLELAFQMCHCTQPYHNPPSHLPPRGNSPRGDFFTSAETWASEVCGLGLEGISSLSESRSATRRSARFAHADAMTIQSRSSLST